MKLTNEERRDLERQVSTMMSRVRRLRAPPQQRGHPATNGGKWEPKETAARAGRSTRHGRFDHTVLFEWEGKEEGGKQKAF